MNKPLRVLVFLGALLLVLAVMALLGVRSGDRSALQKYQAELRAKGEKLTFAELTRGRQNNAVDSHAIITNAVRKLDGAGFTPDLLKVRRYVGPGQASVTWKQASPKPYPALYNLERLGDDLDTWKEFAAQIEHDWGTLREIREALQKPDADAGPYTNMLLVPRVNCEAIRMGADWLVGAAENELHQGRLGLQDLEAIAALAQMERDEYLSGAQTIRITVAGLGFRLTWEALEAPGWTEPQLERVQKAWEALDLLDAAEKGLLGDRASACELFAIVRRSRGSQLRRSLQAIMGYGWSPEHHSREYAVADHIYIPAYKITSIDMDELFCLETLQEGVAALRLVKAHRPWSEARQLVIKADARMNAITTMPDSFRHLFSVLFKLNLQRRSEQAVEGEVERQMTLAVIALKRYQLRHGNLPASLEALVPEFLPAVPYDYMAAKPLGYRLKADGSYVLYSVGADGKDDGGDPTLPPGTPPSLWGGRDAVWPSPVTEAEQPPR